MSTKIHDLLKIITKTFTSNLRYLTVFYYKKILSRQFVNFLFTSKVVFFYACLKCKSDFSLCSLHLFFKKDLIFTKASKLILKTQKINYFL